jgi:hypothetical protein
VRAVTNDSNAALVAIAVVASALTVALVYLVARGHAPRAASVIAALGLAASPLFWQQSEVALPYTVLALLSTVFAAAFGALRRGAVPLAFAFGLASGVRQDLPLLLGPLWLWSLRGVPLRTGASALVAFAAACLVWLVPSALLSGGLAPYLDAVAGQAAHVGTTFSVAARGTSGLIANLAFTTYAVAWGLGAFALVVVFVGGARLLALRGRASVFFALWLIPPLVVYVGLHIGDPGYVLSILPGSYVLCAPLVTRLGRLAVPVGATLVLANSALFIAGGSPFTAPAIAEHDAALRARIAAVRSAADASTTVLAQFDYVLVRYYLPEYRTLFYGEQPQTLSRDARPITLVPARDAVLLFGTTAEPPPGLRREPITSGLDRLVGSADLSLVAYDVEPARQR